MARPGQPAPGRARDVDWRGVLLETTAGKPAARASLRRSIIRPLRAASQDPEPIMSKLTIVAFDGTRHELDVANGSTVMENAVRNSVPGIEAECGGACACATCHVYVDDAWSATVGSPEAMEEDMLDFAYDVRPTSRLSCQIKMSDALDGLVVHVPERQA
jgi:2Fe-2S ferredoxin